MRCLCVALCIAAAVLPSEAEPPSRPEFPFQFCDGLLWVEVTAPRSAQPLNFLLDTGAEVSVISLSTARRLGLRLATKVRVQGVRASLVGHWPQRLSATVGTVSLPMDYLVVDLSKLSQACSRRVDGLVGADFFRERVVQIDFATQTVRILSPAATAERGDVLPLEVRPRGMCAVVSVNSGLPKRVRLDTGCASALEWVTSRVPPEQDNARLAVGLAQLTIPQASTTVELGRYRFTGVPTGLHRKSIFPGEAGLVGNGLLSRFARVTIDAARGRLILEGAFAAN